MGHHHSVAENLKKWRLVRYFHSPCSFSRASAMVVVRMPVGMATMPKPTIRTTV